MSRDDTRRATQEIRRAVSRGRDTEVEARKGTTRRLAQHLVSWHAEEIRELALEVGYPLPELLSDPYRVDLLAHILRTGKVRRVLDGVDE